MTLDELQKRLLPLAKAYDLDLIVLHGSVASGSTHRGSDIDLAVLGPARTDMADLTFNAIKALGRDDVDIGNLRGSNPTLGFMVAKTGKVVFEKTPDTFLDYCSLAARKYYDAAKFRRARREMLEQYAGTPKP